MTNPDREEWIDLREERAVRLRALTWGSEGPVVLLAHAASTCAGSWAPVAERLRGRATVLAYDLRGHGDSDQPAGRRAYDWNEFAEDFAGVVRWVERRLGRRVDLCATHSFAGDCALIACARHDLPLGRLILLDPVLADYAGATQGGETLAEGTLRLGEKERDGFASRSAAADWIERCLRRQLARDGLDARVKEALARWAVFEDSDGRFRFKCRRENEAEIYRNRVAIASYLRDQPRIETHVRLVFARKRRAKDDQQAAAFDRDWAEAETVVERCRGGEIEIMENVGHFLVLEAPDDVAELLQKHVTG
jgi:pimeloyl-ACP methyl ester carboxylesterase